MIGEERRWGVPVRREHQPRDPPRRTRGRWRDPTRRDGRDTSIGEPSETTSASATGTIVAMIRSEMEKERAGTLAHRGGTFVCCVVGCMQLTGHGFGVLYD